MYKKKIGNGMQIMALFLFTIMALACVSKSSLVNGTKDLKHKNSAISSPKEGAAVEIPIDSLTLSNDFALL